MRARRQSYYFLLLKASERYTTNEKRAVNNIKLIKGDVKKVIPKLVKLKQKFDRILMPLPKRAEDFI